MYIYPSRRGGGGSLKGRGDQMSMHVFINYIYTHIRDIGLSRDV